MLKQARERTHDKGFFANDTHVLALHCVVELQLLRLHREKLAKKLLQVQFLAASMEG